MVPIRRGAVVGARRATLPLDGHRANSAAVVALPPRENANDPSGRPLEVKLACKFDGGFGCFGTSHVK